jgi:anti-sigma factor RsiW
MTKSCSEINPLLEDFLDGTLSPGQKSLVERHLRDCSACRLELESARNVIDSLKALPEVRCTDRALRLIENATLREEEQMSLLERIKLRGDFSLWRAAPVAVAGAAVVLLLLLTVVDRDRPTRPEYSTQEALQARVVARESLVQIVGVINRTERKAVAGFLKRNLPDTLRKTIRSVTPFQKGGKA